MQGKARKFCLGVDFDCDLDGGDGKKLRLLSWSGCWPDCTFDGDRGVSSIEEFFDELVEEITAAQQQAETVARIYEERDRRSLQAIKPPSSTSFWDRAAGICLLAAIILSVYAADGKILLAGGSISGIVLLWTGLLNLKWQSESSRPMWSRGWWRVAAGAGLIAMPAINGMLVNDINISAAINCNIAACPGF
jgi:hypothetical protein